MDKLYLQQLLPIDYAYMLGYFAICVLALSGFIYSLGYRDRSTYLLSYLFLGLLLAVMVVDTLIDFLPYMPDTELYTKIIRDGFNPGLEKGRGPYAFYNLDRALGWLYGRRPLLFCQFSQLVYVMACLIFVRAWELFGKSKHINWQRPIAIIMLMILPSGVLFTTAPLREGFLIFGFALFLLGFVWFYKRKLQHGLISGSIIMLFIRPPVALFSIASVGLWNFLQIHKRTLLKLVGVVVGLFVMVQVLDYLNYGISPEWMGRLRNEHVANLSNQVDAYGPVEWYTYADVLMDLPALSAQFMFSPLPILKSINPLSKAIAFVDCIYLLLVFGLLSVNLKTVLKQYSFWVVIIGLFVVLLGLYEYSLTGAVRHRLPISLLLVTMGAEYVSRFFYKLSRHDA